MLLCWNRERFLVNLGGNWMLIQLVLVVVFQHFSKPEGTFFIKTTDKADTSSVNNTLRIPLQKGLLRLYFTTL